MITESVLTTFAGAITFEPSWSLALYAFVMITPLPALFLLALGIFIAGMVTTKKNETLSKKKQLNIVKVVTKTAIIIGLIWLIPFCLLLFATGIEYLTGSYAPA